VSERTYTLTLAELDQLRRDVCKATLEVAAKLVDDLSDSSAEEELWVTGDDIRAITPDDVIGEK